METKPETHYEVAYRMLSETTPASCADAYAIIACCVFLAVRDNEKYVELNLLVSVIRERLAIHRNRQIIGSWYMGDTSVLSELLDRINVKLDRDAVRCHIDELSFDRADDF